MKRHTISGNVVRVKLFADVVMSLSIMLACHTSVAPQKHRATLSTV